MKKDLILLVPVILVFSLLSCHRNKESNNDKQGEIPVIRFESMEYDFGTIPYESDGRCYFEFTNNSDTPLVINVVRTTCGCTKPTWPKKPVAPGEKDRIGVTYNTKLKGKFSKTLTVYSNATDSPVKLFIKGNVSPE